MLYIQERSHQVQIGLALSLENSLVNAHRLKVWPVASKRLKYMRVTLRWKVASRENAAFFYVLEQNKLYTNDVHYSLWFNSSLTQLLHNLYRHAHGQIAPFRSLVMKQRQSTTEQQNFSEVVFKPFVVPSTAALRNGFSTCLVWFVHHLSSVWKLLVKH